MFRIMSAPLAMLIESKALTTTVLRLLSRCTQMSRYQKNIFTHSHLSWSSTILYQLPPSTMIHRILPVQFMWTTVILHHLCPDPLWSTSWSEFWNPPVPLPNNCLLFATHARTITTSFAVVPKLCHLFIVYLSTLPEFYLLP